MTTTVIHAQFVSDFANGEGISCHAEIPSGKGKRSITFVIGAEKLKLIAAALAHTDHVGHAAWHAENSFYAMPCSGCKKEK